MACWQTARARICTKSGCPGDIPGVHHLTSVRPPSSSCVTAAEARDRVHQHTALQPLHTHLIENQRAHQSILEHVRAHSYCDKGIWIWSQAGKHLRSTFQCIGMHSQQKRIRGRAKQISSVQRKLQRISREYQRNGWNEIYNTFSVDLQKSFCS